MKGQSAVEYVVTYGWALVALAVVIMLLFYMNVFNPAAWAPVNNEAIGLSVFGVTDFSVNGTGSITLYLVNNQQATVNLTDIKIQGTSLSSLSPALPQVLTPGANLTIKGISTIRGTRGDAFYSYKIDFNYTVINGAQHTDEGVLQGKID